MINGSKTATFSQPACFFVLVLLWAGSGMAQDRRTLLKDIFFQTTLTEWIAGNEVMQLHFDPASGKLSRWYLGPDSNLIQPGIGPSADVSLNGQWMLSKHDGSVKGYRIGVAEDAQSVVFQVVQEVVVNETVKAELSTSYRIFPAGKNWERWAEFHLPVSAEGEIPSRFDGFRFTLPGWGLGGQKGNRLYVPGPFFTHSFVKPGTPVTDFLHRSMTFHSAPDAGFGLFAVSAQNEGAALATWVQSAGQVACIPALEGDGKWVHFSFTNLRAYFLYPGATFRSDVQHVVWASSLPGALAQFRNDMQRAIPMDDATPDWVKGMVLLEVYPSYFPDGFKGIAKRLPFYRSVGFNTIYLMPHWRGGYSPLDLYTVNEAYGTPSDLKQLVAEAHELGMRVLFDMVIHGFNPRSGVVNDRPDLFVKTDTGGLALHPTWKSVTTDWASPAYQQYMADLVRHDVREYGIDGYRVDAATYKGAGWNPEAPYPAYRDGSAAPELMEAMLRAMRETRPDAVLLSEVFGPAFYGVCNLAHDNQTEAVQLLLEKMDAGTYTAQDYKRHLELVFSVLPSGANRVFFARNHDTSWFFRFGGYTPRFLSMDAVHIFFAIPEFFAGDPGHGPHPEDDPAVYNWYSRMLAYRKRFPEFSAGERLWSEAAASDSMVFSGLRKHGEHTHLVLINMAGEQKEVELSLNLPRDAAGKWVLMDPLTGKSQKLVQSADQKWQVRMAPFQVLAGRLTFLP